MRDIASLAMVLSLLSSGCMTPALLSIGAGEDWRDELTPPPQSRIVPDGIAFCADGIVVLHADAYPPPDVQWRGHAEVPVRVSSSFALPDPRKVSPLWGIEYRDVQEGVCGPVAETVRIARAPQQWSAFDGVACARRAGPRLVRDQALSPDGTAPVPPELLDAVPARSIEVVVTPDERALVPLHEPHHAVYAALPIAIATDALSIAGFTLAMGFSAAGVVPVYFVIATPFLVAGKIQARVSRFPMNLAGKDLTRETFPVSDSLAGRTLRCAKLVGVDLRGARLADADLANARLVDADLRGADLSHVRNLTQRQLDFACVDAETRLPPGLAAPPPCF